MEGSERTRPSAQRVSGGLLAEITRALKGKDIEALSRIYADDAVIEEVSSRHPPAHPNVTTGRPAILERLQEDLFRDPVSDWARELDATEILDGIETDDGLAFTEVRVYAAGDRVVAQHLARKRNGLIGHDRVVVAWDAE
ncbi:MULTISPECIES: hypothetical protein [Sorangium]|uniref:SnoaL-like domain-containing protein n=1 Tax=Sorangium cellulosum TaxID=56 RepID=A0A4P2QK39_SORCE|nr:MULTISPECIES: hypothetical protein [Sorangium]AUX30096.1 hypothetical protein SOCE836_021930 [Sorangium cellulosum]WCQ89487.1 hypothetical protein NQZ70_02176 [Sorangium sp. Soce836]